MLSVMSLPVFCVFSSVVSNMLRTLYYELLSVCVLRPPPGRSTGIISFVGVSAPVDIM